MYSSIEAAAEIGTTPRLLRRFLRANDSWKNATQAGRYSFTESELASLKKQFNHWQGTRSTRPPRTSVRQETELSYLDQDKGISVEQMMKMKNDPYLRSEVFKRRQERRKRLMNRLMEMNSSDVQEEVDA
jgi:hypothetical protein